jgi:peptidoglycan/xylan/chitin deacetylase (PgdA/CDA1 family)
MEIMICSAEDYNMKPCHYPALVISLDFELHWGMYDRVRGSDHSYWNNLVGAPSVVEEVLSTFKKYEIHATWATVGALFARNRKDLSQFIPPPQPDNGLRELNSFAVAIGEDEADDPLHFAGSLIEKIIEAPGQELASHTFSHHYCLERGQTKETFQRDLSSSQAIARNYGVALRSLVFPRNQVNPAYIETLPELGFEAYRGNPRCILYDPAANRWYNSPPIRLLRWADTYVNLTGHHAVAWSELADSYPVNVKASRFLRACSPKLRILDRLKRRRVIEGIRYAAERKEVFHLWWHPHNFGSNLRQNLSGLEEILEEFDRIRPAYDMQSLNMLEVANEVFRTNRATMPGK